MFSPLFAFDAFYQASYWFFKTVLLQYNSDTIKHNHLLSSVVFGIVTGLCIYNNNQFWNIFINSLAVTPISPQTPDPLPCCCSVTKRVWLFGTPWTVAHQAPLSTGLPRQEYWSGLPFPSLGDLPNQGIEPESPALADRFFTAEPPGKPHSKACCCCCC